MASKLKSQATGTETSDPLAKMLEQPAGKRRHDANSTLYLGKLLSCSPPEVQLEQHGKQIHCTPVSMVPLSGDDVGRTVVISVLADSQGHIILGLLQPAQNSANESADLKVNNKRVEIAADEEIVLRCGDASIRIDQTGAITVKGKALLSRAEGTNRVQGGAVQIN